MPELKERGRRARLGGSKPPKRKRAGKEVAPMNERQPDTSTYSGRVAARIRELRKKRKLERSQLRDALAQYGVAISMPALYAYENGNRPVNPDHYPAFAKALGCSSVRSFLPAE